MINILIVEDELSALDRISSFRIWSENNFRIAATARNGREGVEKFRSFRIDIILTDIEMPLMNGIQMISEIRKIDTLVPIIILSCHESFDYARQAVSLGVREYILKDFMEEKSVRLALSKVFPAGGKAARTDENAVEQIKPPGDSKELIKAVNMTAGYSSLALRKFRDSSLTFLIIHIDCFSVTKHDPEKFLKIIDYQLKVLSFDGYTGITAYEDRGDFWVLLEGDPLRFAEEFFDRMRNRTYTVTIAVGESFHGTANLKMEASCVRTLFGYRVFLGNDRIILPGIAKGIGAGSPGDIRKKIDLVRSAVNESSPADCLKVLRELYDRDLPGMLKYNYLEYVNQKLLAIIFALSERGEINIRELTGREYLSIKELEEKETVSEMREWFENIFKQIFKIDGNDISAGISNRNVLKVINIIKTRYDEELNLEEMSEEIGVHKVYLSRLFKKETGRNYYDYLQSYRIHKSELLLGEDNLKMYEIARKAGFKSYDQFAVVFKKYKGISPSEYRKEKI